LNEFIFSGRWASILFKYFPNFLKIKQIFGWWASIRPSTTVLDAAVCQRGSAHG
jgi:hypothetical protein